MLIGEIIRVALDSMRANLFRAILTMLGIIIGVAAVITMVALGTGAQRAIDAQIEALGANVLTINAGQAFQRGVARDQLTLTMGDAAALAAEAPHVTAVVPEISSRQQVKYADRNVNSSIIGTTPDYAPVRRYTVAEGRMFTAADDTGRRRVAVLGAEVPEMLGQDPHQLIGATIQIRSIPFEVIGVFERKGSPGFGNPDDDVWIPLSTARYRVAGSDRLSTISAEVADGVDLQRATLEIERVLRREHHILPGKDNNFSIYDPKAFLSTRQEATEIFTYLLASIAGVSLLVGGIGIMNIMLVTVTERTREIGVRKAMGATRMNILLQFLVESLVMCLVGGVLGVLLGTSAALLLARFAGWQVLVSPVAIAAAFAFSAAVGLFFGIWPARRAAGLDPIEALRYE